MDAEANARLVALMTKLIDQKGRRCRLAAVQAYTHDDDAQRVTAAAAAEGDVDLLTYLQILAAW